MSKESVNNSQLGIHIVRNDLRTKNAEALFLLREKTNKIAVVYVFDESWLTENSFGFNHLGEHRKQFLDQALTDFKSKLDELNIRFYCLYGDPVNCVCELIEENEVSYISYEYHSGVHEKDQISAIKSNAPHIEFIEGFSNYLFDLKELPFDIENMPNVFSPFRRKVEKLSDVQNSISEIKVCPKMIHINVGKLEQYSFPESSEHSNKKDGSVGGESAALVRIDDYFFETDRIAKYKETRNGLDGSDFSSRLSAYLALGCVSPISVIEKLEEYETSRVKNESTYWLFFELLWREFFHLQLSKHTIKFFKFSGIQDKEPLSRFDDSLFNKWVNGNTGYDIVDACMKQLMQTGFMSNRGRQLVASCFVHELNLDWRYGAAYFEHALIDFDVASNFGNWQYLAGVGSDPRGHRQFNLEKQTNQYDPNRDFIKRYLNK